MVFFLSILHGNANIHTQVAITVQSRLGFLLLHPRELNIVKIIVGLHLPEAHEREQELHDQNEHYEAHLGQSVPHGVGIGEVFQRDEEEEGCQEEKGVDDFAQNGFFHVDVGFVAGGGEDRQCAEDEV